MQGYPIPTNGDESVILDACRRSGVEGLDLLYRMYGPSLRRFCRRRVQRPADVDDAVQETLLRAHRTLHALPADTRLWSWLTTIAARVCVDIHLRDERFARAQQAPEPAAVDLDEELRRRVRTEIVLEALDKLSPAARTPLVLHGFMGWKYREIAEVLGQSVPWVKTTIMRTKRLLRSHVRSAALRRGQWPLPAAVALRKLSPRSLLSDVRARLHRGAARLPGWWQLGPDVPLAASTCVLACVVAVVAPFAPSAGRVPPPEPAPAGNALVVQRPAEVRASAPVDGGQRPRTPQEDGADGRSGAVAVPTSSGPAQDGLVLVTEPVEGALFHDFTPSPGYERDGTVFAVGTGTHCYQCRVLFRSQDRGATWTQLPAVGLTGHRLLLPPAYPRDPRIFAGGVGALQVSLDGGRTFTTVAAGMGFPVMSPGFSRGDDRIFLPDRPGWEYDAASGAIKPLVSAVLPPSAAGLDLYLSIAVPPTYPADDTVWFGLTETAGAAAYRCKHGSCIRSVLPSRDGARVNHLALGGTVFAWNNTWVASSDDDGRTFRALSSPPGGWIQQLSAGPSGTLHLLREGDGGVRLYSSFDSGRSWVNRRFSAAAPEGVVRVVELSDGRMFGAVNWYAKEGRGTGGIVCSVNGGEDWAVSCGP